MTMEKDGMPTNFEPGLWSVVLAAVTGAAGWIWRGKQRGAVVTDPQNTRSR